MPAALARLRAILIKWVEPNLRAWFGSRQPLIWVLALLAGLAVAAAAILFRLMIGWTQLFWLGDTSERVHSIARELPWPLLFLGPVGGGLLVGLALRYLLAARRCSGVADVIEARALGGRRISLRDGLVSAGVTALSLGSGASAGREGPVVHLGAVIASAVGRGLRLPDWGQRTLLGCGVAAAISASFNAPIAGVLFAHEVILGHYAMRAFVPIVLASVSATIVSRLWFGDVAAFTIPAYQITSLWEFPAFALLGVVCALVSVIFQASLMIADFVARNVPIPLVLRPAVGGVAVGAIALIFPQVLGVGYEATDQALRHELPLWLLLSLLVAKTAATAITLASRFGGGIFSPSLYIGAMTGGAFGLIAAGVFPDMASSEGLYAILGMGAVAAAVLGAPISTTVIVFELTGGYALSIALLLTVSIANGLNNALHGHSFFHWQLEMRGVSLRSGPHLHVLRARRVRHFMTPPDSEPETVDAAAPGLPRLKADDTLEQALRLFDTSGHDRLPVAGDGDPARLVGWASQVDALRYFNRALVEASQEEHQS
ncbi:MAG: chloride channel protein [Alphaproteobacteria bacterium]|nr:MAG: chloride channel protein [Alphaproteobacteria bacterium]